MPATQQGGHVLVVEDDPAIRRLIARVLRLERFEISEAATIDDALSIVERGGIDVVLIDLGLGGDDGLILVRELSAIDDLGLIIVSGRMDSPTRVLGIELGADDFICKPFDNRELAARVRRRYERIRSLRAARTGPAASQVTVAGLSVDLVAHTVTRSDGTLVKLSESEFAVLRTLIDSRGAILSRDDIHRTIFGSERDPLDRRIDTHVANIRKKLGGTPDSAIRTVHRAGYVLD